MIKKIPEVYESQIIDNLLKEISPKEQKKTERKMLLAMRIQDAMESKGIKNKELARILNKQPSEITKWLSGTHNFTIDTLGEIEEVLGISLINLKKADQCEQLVFVASYSVEQKMDRPVSFPTFMDYFGIQKRNKSNHSS
jgi:ribosome-binding protein aMBF1 (putative translation factor)